MGIHHILPLGVSPGVVTSPLAYMKYQYDQNNVAFFGKDSNRQKVKPCNDIIIFTTRDIYNGSKKLDEHYIDNVIYKMQGIPRGKGSTPVIEVVKKYIKSDYSTMLQAEGARVYWLESRPGDFDFNLDQLLKALYVLSPPNKVGKEIWVNLTGGTNIVNIALSTATALSGVTGRQYYTYVAHSEVGYLRPSTRNDEYWCNIPVLKVTFDRSYEVVIRILSTMGELSSDNLWSLIRQEYPAFPATKDSFVSDFLNKLDGWLTERPTKDEVALSASGRRFLELIDNPLVQAHLYKQPLENPPTKDIFEEIPL